MDPILTKSLWNEAKLDGKTVEFRIPSDGHTYYAVGKFLAVDCPGGFLSLRIVWSQSLTDGSTNELRIPVPQIGADRIEEHPDQSVAHYRIFV
jgi:hypothetical protein